MASIGEIIPQEGDNPTAPAVGQALMGGQPPPDPTLQQHPAYGPLKQWIQKPENLMTALVFLGSVVQPKTGGRNSLQTVAQRGLGALAFRHELNQSQLAEQFAREKATREQQEFDVQAQYRKDDIATRREQIGATNANTMSDERVAGAQIAAQQGMNTQDNETDMAIARMQAEQAAALARLAQQGQNPLYGPDEMKAATDLVNSSIDAGTPITYAEALRQVMGPKLMALGLVNVREIDIPPPSTPPTATSEAKPKPQANTRTSGRGRALTPEEQRQVKTRQQVQSVKATGKKAGEALENFGATQNRPKEKF